MKLELLLKTIAPLPWKFIPEARIHTGPEADYALHAANVLPELVEAAKVMDDAVQNSENDDFECANHEVIKKMRAALVRAEEVK